MTAENWKVQIFILETEKENNRKEARNESLISKMQLKFTQKHTS